MAEERSTLILDIQIKGKENLQILEKFKKTAKDADSVTKKLSEKMKGSESIIKAYSQGFSNLDKNLKNVMKSVSAYSSGMDKINAIDKAHSAVIKNKEDSNKKLSLVYKELTKQINQTTDATEKAILREKRQAVQVESTANALKHEAELTKLATMKKKELSAEINKSTQYTSKYIAGLQQASADMERFTPGVERLTGALKEQDKIKKNHGAMEERIAADIAETERAINSATDATEKSLLKEKQSTLIKAQNRIEIEKSIALNKLYAEQKRSQARIIEQADRKLKLYKKTLSDLQKEVKGQLNTTDKLASAYRNKARTVETANDVLRKYEKNIQKTTAKLETTNNVHKQEALQLKLSALEQAKHSVELERNVVMSRMNAEAIRAKTQIEKDATKAIYAHKDSVAQIKKEINNETSVIHKAILTHQGYREIKQQAMYTDKHYTDEIKKTEKQIKNTTDAYVKEALEQKKNILITAQAKAADMAHNSVLELKRMRIEAVSNALTKASQSLQRFGRFMSRYVTTTMMAALVQGVKFQANIEAQTIRFGILVRNMEKGRDLFQQVVAFSAKTPFLLPDLDEAAQILLAFGSPLESVMDELRMLGDVAQGDAEKLERVATSFGKVRARGTAHMRELNRFIMSGIPIIEELNNQFGTTGDTIFRMIQKNEITFANINEAMVNMTSSSGRFYKMTDTIAKTLEGRFSTAVDNLNLNLAKLVEDFTPKIKTLLERFIDWSQGFRLLDAQTRQLTVKMMALAAAIGPATIAMAGFVKVLANAVAGNYFGAIILGISTIAGLVSWGIMKDKIDEISISADKMKASMEALERSTSFVKEDFPGMTQELWDLARSTGDYALALEQANQRLALEQRLLKADNVLTNDQIDLYDKFIKLSKREAVPISSGPLAPIEKGGLKVSVFDFFNPADVGDVKDIVAMLTEVFPEVGDIVSARIQDTFGTALDFDTLKAEQIARLNIADLFNKIASTVVTESGTLIDAVRASVQKDVDDIGRGKVFEELKGLDPSAMFRSWGELVTKGISDIGADVEDGLLDFSAAISRATSVREAIHSMEEEVKALITSGGLELSDWEEFYSATTHEELLEQIKADGERAIQEYASFLKGAVDIRIFEIKEESKLDNVIASLLGLGNEADTKKQLQTQLDDYIGLLKSFGYTAQQIHMFESGELMTPVAVKEVMKAVDIAKKELQVILDREEKLSLFNAFFQGDASSFEKYAIESQIRVMTEALSAGLASVSMASMPHLMEGINDLLTSDIDLDNNKVAVLLSSSLMGITSDEFKKNISEVDKVKQILLNFEAATGYSVLGIVDNLTLLYESLDNLGKQADTAKIESVFSSFFGAGTKKEGEEALRSMLNNLNLEKAIVKALTEIKTDDPTVLINALLFGNDIEGLSDETKKELETFFKSVLDDIDISGHSSIIERLVGSPDNLKQDLQQMLNTMKFEEALKKAVESAEGTSSIDLLSVLIADPEAMRNSPQYRSLVELFTKAFPEEIAELSAELSDDLIKAFLGTKPDWELYWKDLAIADMMADYKVDLIEFFEEFDIGEASQKRVLELVRTRTREDLMAMKKETEYFADTQITSEKALFDLLSKNKSRVTLNITEMDDGSFSVLAKGHADSYISGFTSQIEALDFANRLIDVFSVRNLFPDTSDEDMPDFFVQLLALIEKYDGLKKETKETTITIEELWDDVFEYLGNSIRDNLLSTIEDLGEALVSMDFSNTIQGIRDVASEIMKAVPQMMFQAGWAMVLDKDPTNDTIGWVLMGASGIAMLGSGIAKGLQSSSEQSTPGSISYSAKGDIFNNGYIANAPTLRSTPYGASMVGEAGSEAVMPLTRTSGGQLGVQATTAPVIINVNNNSSARVEATETKDANGARVVEFAIYDAVKKGFATGEFDNSLSAYGVNRRGRR
jgi:hypothetical protein